MVTPKHIEPWIQAEVASGIYERHRKLRQGDVVLDIGAHFGHFSMMAVEKIMPGGIIHAFEPNEDNFNKLVENCSGLSIYCHPEAAWDSTGQFPFNVSETTYNHSLMPIGNLVRTITVDTLNIGKWCLANRVTPTFVKLDAECSEAKVIHSILLAGLTPEFAIEVHTEALFQECFTIFRKAGYSFDPTDPTGRRTMLYAWYEPDDIGAL